MRPALKGARLAIVYLRVSTAEQGHSGLGLEAQQASVRAYVEAQGLDPCCRVLGRGQWQGRPAAGLPGGAGPLPAAWCGAGRRSARPDHPPRPHPLRASGGGLRDPGSRHARRR